MENNPVTTENLPFCYNRHRIKAIVLGADPGNLSNHGKTVEIRVAFALGSGDNRYFEPIRKNMERIGLSIEDVYVQNLITENTGIDTSNNMNWKSLAKKHLPHRLEEFKLIDPECRLPVLVTAEKILQVLYKGKLPEAGMLYKDSAFQPIPASQNKLNRKIFPFYRNPKYNLSNPSWIEYRDMLVKHFK